MTVTGYFRASHAVESVQPLGITTIRSAGRDWTIRPSKGGTDGTGLVVRRDQDDYPQHGDSKSSVRRGKEERRAVGDRRQRNVHWSLPSWI